jgi:hypothetical protein
VGWVITPAAEYVRPVRRVAVRWKHTNGPWEYALIISTLRPHAVIAETNQPIARICDPQAVVLAYVQCYDAGGGGVETSFRNDKPGLGMTKRNKQRFAASAAFWCAMRAGVSSRSS